MVMDRKTYADLQSHEALIEWGSFRLIWTGEEFDEDNVELEIFGQRIVDAKPLEQLQESAVKIASFSPEFKERRAGVPSGWFAWVEDEGVRGWGYTCRQIDLPNNVPHKDRLYCSVTYPRGN